VIAPVRFLCPSSAIGGVSLERIGAVPKRARRRGGLSACSSRKCAVRRRGKERVCGLTARDRFPNIKVEVGPRRWLHSQTANAPSLTAAANGALSARNRPIAATPAAPASGHRPDRSSDTPPIARTGNRNRPGNHGESFHAEHLRKPGFDEDGNTVPQSGSRSRGRVTAHRPRGPTVRSGSGRRHRPRTRRRNRIAAQVHAVRAAGERDIQPLVDDHPRLRSAGEAHELDDERRQRRSLEIGFSHLNEIDAGPARRRDIARPPIVGADR